MHGRYVSVTSTQPGRTLSLCAVHVHADTRRSVFETTTSQTPEMEAEAAAETETDGWHHVALTRRFTPDADSSSSAGVVTARLYTDGKVVHESTGSVTADTMLRVTAAAIGANTYVAVAGTNAARSGFHGRLAHVRVYGAVLTAAEIADIRAHDAPSLGLNLNLDLDIDDSSSSEASTAAMSDDVVDLASGWRIHGSAIGGDNDAFAGASVLAADPMRSSSSSSSSISWRSFFVDSSANDADVVHAVSDAPHVRRSSAMGILESREFTLLPRSKSGSGPPTLSFVVGGDVRPFVRAPA
jgi:hypothetical protein